MTLDSKSKKLDNSTPRKMTWCSGSKISPNKDVAPGHVPYRGRRFSGL
jgi:hypothetical protein